MKLTERIGALSLWGKRIEDNIEGMKGLLRQNYYKNRWFTEENTELAITNIATNFLRSQKLNQWISAYNIPEENNNPQTTGLVMAGNIPLVGFHDLLCVLITGNRAQIKLSSKDNILLTELLKFLFEISPEIKEHIEIVERLKNFDAVIATGSNNSARYFEYYFGKHPHIIRKNRNSIAILTGEETAGEIKELGKDIFRYFGLGCRNVSKLIVPMNFNFINFLDSLEDYSGIMEHAGYKHNYDYQRTLLLLNNTPHYASDFLMLVENKSLHSPIATLHYEFFDTIEEAILQINNHKDEIQCVASSVKIDLPTIPFGATQSPELWDYADKVDVVKFLVGLGE